MGTSDEEIDRLLGKLTPRARALLLNGATTWRTRAEPAVELRELVMSDGPAGVRGEAWDERSTSLLLPSASALAATWDEALVEDLGGLLAAEARRKGVDVLLAPTLNLHRSPLGGRHFECLSEDPELTGRIGAALVRGIQAHGVAATAKHYVANDSETDRLTVDVRVGERALREVYLAPFEAAVAAGVRLVMAGYNAVNGTTMTANALLTDPLKSEWGFDGVVVSDWGAVRGTTGTARAGLDLAMPGPDGPWGEALARAVAEGAVPEPAVDDKARRLLRLAAWLGALGGRDVSRSPVPGRPADSPGAEGADGGAGAGPSSGAEGLPGRGPAHGAKPSGPRPRRAGDGRALARRAVAAGAVLLANKDVLPLDPEHLGTVAVIGAHAARTRTQGGGSAGVFPRGEVSVLDGIRAELRGRARVVHVPGPRPDGPAPPLDPDTCTDPRSGLPGVLLRMLDADGRELYAERRRGGRLLEPRLVPGAHTVEIRARLCPRTGGSWSLGVAGFGRMSLTTDGRTLLEGDFPPSTDDPAVMHVNPPAQYATADLTAGRDTLLVARRELAPGTGRATVLVAAPPAPDVTASLAEAVRAAGAADAAVVVVGTTEHGESEGYDRTDLALGATQDALVRAVAAANPRTVAVVNSGGPVELPWREQAGAVLLAWFPGQEGGGGLADVLFGHAEPGGRLPTTWPAVLADAPVTRTRPDGGRLDYDEGLHLGHRGWLRHHRTPAYWFGHGLGYTTWRYEELTVPPVTRAGDGLTVRVRVRNTGARAGREVVQVYLARPASALDRPARWLAGYTAVRARPGETVTATVRVPARALRHWSVAEHAWRTEAGPCRVLAGRSAGDVPLAAEVEVVPTASA
ncbi:MULTISPECIES: glycoside hydrolase family 3 C-terminal domain-containing protein [Streptomyces]|uniref:Beta-glucosidase n=1 Tax=Streptomyces coelicolor (strain ATCC BAA-471 / A3(2) / M145) TaxID=100226 RepID=O87852_STRCO|nr:MULTISPECIES: glycoside hydrolase family 3 C-terminal domain-containing protein [Streptomyces]MYU46101.1 glycosyl hydrolase [Streptomyces sp. SID7813]MDX2923755.1 glycoside hydrolase family 3 C-terminal domain-containing protein [Streptomyces sp. NRRL_B-16638]MDX3411196.1 glycoside hydrolase family 3 C-terminal domain-containing protein [Streptomyces sp. ME02-6977A]NSL78478.1 glycosyl hydrolase [Streptomyces coelicolor]QFI46391.1 glycosyl hydrolase [Streptomyces coelicolor A3(2)]